MITTVLAALLGAAIGHEYVRPMIVRYLAKREVARW